MHRIDLSFLGRFGLAVCAFGLSALSASAAAPSLSSPANNATIATLNAAHKEYYAMEQADRRAMDDNACTPSRFNLITNATCFPQKTTFSWTGTSPFRLKILRDADQSVFFETNGLTAKSFAVGNFEIGTKYKWAVSDANGSTSAWRTFTTESMGPRLLDGASEYIQEYYKNLGPKYHFSTPTPHGVRDLGGYTGLDGRRSRQGLLIRSSQLDGEYNEGATNHITNTNRKFWKEFIPVKTEFDLRSSEETKITKSPLGSDVRYRPYRRVSAYARYFGPGKNVNKDIPGIMSDCSNPANFPIVFHCVHGKDRTGALALILGGLLGYKDETKEKDYEATMFWNPLQKNGYLELAEYFRTNTWANTSAPVTVNEGIYNYVLKTGVSAETIDKFRNIMLEPKAEQGDVWAVLGDSYSTWDGLTYVTNAFYPYNSCKVTKKDQLWWSQVISHFGGTEGNIVAGGGSRISEDCLADGQFPMGSFENRAKNGELGTPDHIMILGGLNDAWANPAIPDETLFDKMESLCDKLDSHPNYANAQKIVLLTKLPETQDWGISSVYRSALKQAAVNHGYKVVDLKGAYTESDMVSAHPTARGMTNIANRVIATLAGSYSPPTHTHQYGNWVTNTPPTATTAGQRTKTCVADGCTYPLEKITETLPKTDTVPVEQFVSLVTDGKGYLLTGYKLTSTTHVEMKFQRLADPPNQNQCHFWLDDEADGFEWGSIQWGVNGGISFYYNAPGDSPLEPVSSLSDTNHTHIIRACGNTVQFDNDAPITGPDAFEAGMNWKNIMLFAARNWDEDPTKRRIVYQNKLKLYSLKIWEGDTADDPIRNYVAATNAQGKATLYDTVTKTFLDPPTTGTFAVSNDPEPTAHTHSWSGWSISAEPTVSATGTKRRTCSGCDEVETATLAKLPNRYDWLKTDGKGYILTDYTPNLQKTCIETTFTLLSATDGALWTANKSTLPSGTGCGAQTLLNYDGSRFLYFNQPTDDDVYRSFADGLVGLNDSHVIVTHGQTVDMDGARVVASIEGYTENDKAASGPLMLAAGNYCSEKRHEVVPTAVKLHTLRVREVEGGVTNLVRVYVPCTNASGAATFWDVWNGTYCTVLVNGTGTAAFEVGNGAPTPPEPGPEVETFDWLQTDGNGYILTDYTPNLKKTRIEVVYEQTSHDNGFFWMANACTKEGGTDSGNQMLNYSSGLHGAENEELSYGNQLSTESDRTISYGTPTRYVVSTNVTQGADVWLNGDHYALSDYTPSDVSASGPLVLFAGNWAGKYTDGMKAMLKAKVYRVTISEVDGTTTTAKYNFLPATNALGQATLYDTVNKTFATVLGDEAGYTVGNGYPVIPPVPPTPDPTPTAVPVAVAPTDGATVDILTPTQRQFLAMSTADRRRVFTSQAYRRNLGSWDYGFCDPEPLTIQWTGASGGNAGLCTVRVWRVTADAETLHCEKEVLGTSTTVDNFEVAADYRWEVANALGADGGTFTTRDETPRLLRDPDPEQKIQGIRDLGGRRGLNGRRVKQGRIFRSSGLNAKCRSATALAGESYVNDLNRSWWLDTLKVKTDLDLRSATEVGKLSASPLGNSVTWQHKPGSAYEFADNPSNFKASFDLFLDATKYPFVFHCVAGQDRTGALAFVLETLLGVDEDECLKDWEANAFRLTDVTWNHANGMDEFKAGFEGQAGATLSERIVNWVKTTCGYTDEQINTFRELMLEASEEPVVTYDYLTTDGNGYIDTGIRPNVKTTRLRAAVRFRDLSATANGAKIAFQEVGDRIWGLAFWSGEPVGSLQYFCGSENGDYGVSPSSDFRDSSTVHTFDMCGNTVVMDGVTYAGAPNESDTSEVQGNLELFTRFNSSFDGLKADVYYIQIWNGETLERDLVPAKDPNGMATLYDRVGGVFMTVNAYDSKTVAFSVYNCEKIDPPTVSVTTFEYDGTEKRPLVPQTGDHFSALGDAVAVIPGNYTLSIAPDSGYTWQDGTRTPIPVAWTITGKWNPVETAYGVSNQVTLAGQDYCILSFTNTTATGFDWTVPTGVTGFDFLVVAGGGGGGVGMGSHASYVRTAGGGGAGGVVTGRVESATGTFTVKVGAGGATGAALGANGVNGGDSSLTLGTVDYVVAKGGGYGGGARWTANSTAGTGSDGAAGGSGGGGSAKYKSTTVGGSVTSAVIGDGVAAYESFGNAGGGGNTHKYAGGGGGAGGAGAAATSSASGSGGAGIALTISGVPTTYACGGGTSHTGVKDDGSAAERSTGNGGAGGHGSSGGDGYYGEAGGSGIVIIRYAIGSTPTPTPTPEDKRDIAGVAVVDGQLVMAVENADPRFAYQLRGTNDLIAPRPWPVQWTTNGTGELLIAPPKTLSDKMFYYLQVIQKP